jgi:hypothetical protein
MNSSLLSLVYRPAGAAVAASTIVFALVACAGSASPNTFIAATETGDAGPGDAATKKDGATSKPKVVTAEAACASFAKARCAKAKSCSTFAFAATWGDDSTCESRLLLGCTEKLDAPGVTWKPEGLDACASALPDASCDDLTLDVLPSECIPSAGTFETKEACAFGEQCSTGFCKKGSFGACGSCAEPGKENAYCSRGTDCGPGLLCAGGSCRVPSQQGQLCSSSRPCSPGLVCDGGSCTKGLPAGSPCAESPYDPDPCDHASGVVCSALIMQCQAATVIAIGDSCNPYSDLCAAGGRCSYSECVAPPDTGDSCTVSGSGAGCFAPSVCENGKCVLPSAAACAK